MLVKLLSIISILTFLLVACTPTDKKLQAIIDQTNQVKIVKYATADTIIRRTTDIKDVAIFTEVLKGIEANSVAGNRTGELSYYAKGNKILTATVLRDGIRFTIGGTNYARRFTYQAGMYLDEMK